MRSLTLVKVPRRMAWRVMIPKKISSGSPRALLRRAPKNRPCPFPSNRLKTLLDAAVGSLRFGEITALERRDIDLTHRVIRVRQQSIEIKGEGLVLGPPGSRAGTRGVAMPAAIMDLLAAYLAEHVGPETSARVSTGPKGAPIRRGNLNKLVRWREAVTAIGLPGLHFHNLRHTGNTRDLMVRMGHDSIAAAIFYQHASREADRAIADHLQQQLDETFKQLDDDDEAAETPHLMDR